MLDFEFKFSAVKMKSFNSSRRFLRILLGVRKVHLHCSLWANSRLICQGVS
jgi:hypothetical protein